MLRGEREMKRPALATSSSPTLPGEAVSHQLLCQSLKDLGLPRTAVSEAGHRGPPLRVKIWFFKRKKKWLPPFKRKSTSIHHIFFSIIGISCEGSHKHKLFKGGAFSKM